MESEFSDKKETLCMDGKDANVLNTAKLTFQNEWHKSPNYMLTRNTTQRKIW